MQVGFGGLGVRVGSDHVQKCHVRKHVGIARTAMCSAMAGVAVGPAVVCRAVSAVHAIRSASGHAMERKMARSKAAQGSSACL